MLKEKCSSQLQGYIDLNYKILSGRSSQGVFIFFS
jgi:hypothetical protein